MARTYNDSGIVLRRTDVRDSDRILTILTHSHGKVSALARGLRKPGAKLAAHVDLFAQAELSFATGYNLEILTGAVRTPAPHLGSSLESMAYAGLLAEIVDRTTEPATPVPDLYDLLQSAFSALATSGPALRPTALWHLFRLLDWMGNAPLLTACVQCGRPLPAEPLAFSATAGGFYDPEHRLGRPLLPLSTRPLLFLLASSDPDFFAFPFNAQDLNALEALLLDLFEEHLPSGLKSRRFLLSVLGARP
jgi:DNA repair protein RecO (recombination protein O)